MLDYSYRSILKMAIPLMASTFIQSVVLITDSSFLSRYDIIAFDAVGNGGLVYITLFMTLVGLNDGAQIVMARRIGENKEHLISRIFGSSLVSNFIISFILFAVIMFLMPDFILSFSKSNEVALGQIQYIQIRGYGLFFAAISLGINAFFLATGRTTVVFVSALFIAVSNIGLDYLLINGNAGFPEMGLEGAAIASTISDAIGTLFIIIALFVSKTQRKFELLKHISFGWTSIKQLFWVSAPIMFQGLIALSTWTIFFAWIEQMGTYELTISQNIRSLYFLAFVPVWGFGATTKTYISQYIGKKDFKSIEIIIKRIQILTTIFIVVFFHGAVLYPKQMLSIINPNEIYMQDSIAILQYVSGAVLIYATGSVYFQAINGTGNTRYTFYVELISVTAYLLGAYLLIKVYNADIFWVWSVEYIYFITLGILSFSYIRFFNWQKKEI